MANELDNIVAHELLRKYEIIFHDLLNKNIVTTKAQFEYCYCLVQSRYAADVLRGLYLLDELYRTDETKQRDYVYYMALGNARLKEYTKALDLLRAFLKVEPGNQQIIALYQKIKRRMEFDGLKGLAYAGGFALVVGAIVGVGMIVAKRIHLLF
ncbi:mitochondrial fission 1 protein-like [Aethina tumida]|uniref:mitochondrial fission 1 protein-like n=1 Tax=Aethina tumida TaxID=116153 RepID=UPI002147F581|nr:mitochondrial fission 1 protein-like [Aethina tumida]